MKHPTLAGAAALVIAALASGCSGDNSAKVQIAEVGRATVAEVVDAPGSVQARATAALTAPTDSSVEAIEVEDGATVEKGAVLVRLTSPAARDRLAQARHALRDAKATQIVVPRAELGPLQDQLDAAAHASFAAARAAAAQIDDADRRRAAEQQVADAEQQYAAAARAARATVAQVDAGAAGLESALSAVTATQQAQAQAAVTAAQATVDALTVRAPLAGVVTLGAGAAAPAAGGGDLSGLLSGLPPGLQGQAETALGQGGSAPNTQAPGLTVGQQVPSGAALLTVTDLGGLTVSAEVDETDVLLVERGTKATVELDALPGSRYPATVDSIDLAPTTSGQGGVSYRVRLALGNGSDGDGGQAARPRPGMSAVVNLQVRTERDTVAVGSGAVLRGDGRDAVFVVEDGVARRRAVRLGAQGENLVQVLSGVEPGERVVIRDADRLKDGQAVRG